MPATKKTTVKRQTNKPEQLVLHGTHNYTKLKTLGAGIYGTTYEVIQTNEKPGGEHMAFKVQKILPEYQKQDTEYPLWREIEFQKEFVSNLSPHDREFFNHLYDYEIITNCQHTQKRHKVRVISRPRNKWEKKIFAIDQSPICAYFLMELVRGMTVNEYLQQILNKPNSIPPRKIIINLAQQFVKCLELLQNGGYGHNDEHFNNLMIEPLTNKQPGQITNFAPDFQLGRTAVTKIRYQLKLIDYGMINHSKYKQRPNLSKDQELFLSRPDYYYYSIALHTLSAFLTNLAVCKSVYELHGKQEPEESNPRLDYKLNLIKNIAVSHPKFLSAMISKYSVQYPELQVYIQELFTRINTEVTPGLVKDPARPLKPENYFYLSEIMNQFEFKESWHYQLLELVLFKITEEFRVVFTQEHLKYSGYELLDQRMLKFLAPKKDYLKVLGLQSLQEVIGWIAHLGS